MSERNSAFGAASARLRACPLNRRWICYLALPLCVLWQEFSSAMVSHILRCGISGTEHALGFPAQAPTWRASLR